MDACVERRVVIFFSFGAVRCKESESFSVFSGVSLSPFSPDWAATQSVSTPTEVFLDLFFLFYRLPSLVLVGPRSFPALTRSPVIFSLRSCEMVLGLFARPALVAVSFSLPGLPSS